MGQEASRRLGVCRGLKACLLEKHLNWTWRVVAMPMDPRPSLKGERLPNPPPLLHPPPPISRRFGIEIGADRGFLPPSSPGRDECKMREPLFRGVRGSCYEWGPLQGPFSLLPFPHRFPFSLPFLEGEFRLREGAMSRRLSCELWLWNMGCDNWRGSGGGEGWE